MCFNYEGDSLVFTGTNMKVNFHTIEFMSAEAGMGCKFECSVKIVLKAG